MTVQEHAAPNSRRDRLVEAAAEVFARSGFHRATVQDIATAAGVSTGLLYRYFTGKAHLARAIVDEDRERTRQELERLAAQDVDPRSALRLLIEGTAQQAALAPHECSLLVEIAAEARRDVDIAATVEASEDATITLVADLLRRAGHGDAAEALATVIWSTLDGLAVRVAIAPDFDPRPAAAELVRLLGLDEQATA